jgi:hypothetical protein
MPRNPIIEKLSGITPSRTETMTDVIYIAGGIAVLGLFVLYAIGLRRI